ncbi:hypothetical protein PMAYCL1PPCAC_01181, partial [Pristionchus mayeri]
WTDSFADFFVVYLDALESSNREKIDQGYTDALSHANLILDHQEACLMCVEKILDKLKSRNFVHCTICAAFTFTYKQCIIHLFDPTHIHMEMGPFGSAAMDHTSSVVRRIIPEDLPSRWKAEEDAFASEIARKYASVPLDESRLRPTKAFATESVMRYTDTMPLHLPSPSSTRGVTPINQMIIDIFTMFTNNGMAARLMAELHEHIGARMTYCAACRVITGTREEYYRHLLLRSHLKQAGSDSILLTFTVSTMKNDII